MLLLEWRLRVSALLKTQPRFFLPIARLRQNRKRVAIRRTTDVVIEGFWRCGNHYATYAFQAAQPRPARIAHHFHAPAQLILATKWNVPAVLLIRQPEEAVASATVYFEMEDPKPVLQFYNIFHRAVLPYRDDLVVSDFTTTTTSFGRVIEALNGSYHRHFSVFTGTDQQNRRVDQCIREEHTRIGGAVSTFPLPSDAKARRKTKVHGRLAGNDCESLLAEARTLYSQLKEASIQPADAQKVASGAHSRATTKTG